MSGKSFSGFCLVRHESTTSLTVAPATLILTHISTVTAAGTSIRTFTITRTIMNTRTTTNTNDA